MHLYPTHIIPTAPGRELRLYVVRDETALSGQHIREHATAEAGAGPLCEGIDIPREALGPLSEAIAAACSAAIRLPAGPAA